MVDTGGRGATELAVAAPEPAPSLFRSEASSVAWKLSSGLVDYADALAFMNERADAIRRGEAPETAWLLEHPPTYTAGTSAGPDLPPLPFPLHRTGRGGQVTYHGPGQRVVYLMLDLEKRSRDIRAFVNALESWLIAALATLNVTGERRPDRVGVWVRRPDKPPAPDGAVAEDKIAAIGVRVRRWVTLHGISLNVDPDLAHYRAIVPCGIAEAHLGVTSLADLGRGVPMRDVDEHLRTAFEQVFGGVRVD